MRRTPALIARVLDMVETRAAALVERLKQEAVCKRRG